MPGEHVPCVQLPQKWCGSRGYPLVCTVKSSHAFFGLLLYIGFLHDKTPETRKNWSRTKLNKTWNLSLTWSPIRRSFFQLKSFCSMVPATLFMTGMNLGQYLRGVTFTSLLKNLLCTLWEGFLLGWAPEQDSWGPLQSVYGQKVRCVSWLSSPIVLPDYPSPSQRSLSTSLGCNFPNKK